MAAIVAILIGGIAFSAAAQEEHDEAKEAFEQGKQLFKDGDFADAAAAFRKANRLRPNWKLLYNIGQSEAAAKRYGLAIEAFERYTAEGGDEISEARQTEIMVELERLRGKVGDLRIEAPDGATVKIDGLKRGVTPLAGSIRVVAGIEHDLVLERDGEVLLERAVKVGAKASLSVAVEEEPEVEEPAAEEPEVAQPEVERRVEADDGGRLRTAGWVLFGTGAAVAIAGAVTGGLAMSKEKDLSEECTGGVCTEAQRDLYDSTKNLSVITNVLLPVGAAVAVAGLVMVFASPGEDEPADETATITPVITAGGGGLVLGGRF